MTLHVVHVLHSLETGGLENGVVNLVTALRDDMRHTVVTMTESGPPAERLPADVGVHSVGRRPGNDVRAIISLARRLRGLRPSVVHSRNWGAFDAVLVARVAGAGAVVHGEHGREATDPLGLNRRRNRLRRLCAPLIDRFVAVSHDLERWLIDTVRIRASKVVAIHNGVDASRFTGAGREAARRTLQIAPDEVVVGTVGRLDPVKDHLGLAEAFAGLADGARARLVIVGDGPCRAALTARASQPDLGGRVTLLGERADVPALLGAFDVFVLPSIAEGLSNTILEAMASGLPVVATRTGGNPEVIEDGVTGTLVPVGDRAALTGGLQGYVRDRERAARHGRAGHQRVVERFALARMVERYRDLYRGLAARRLA